MSSDDNNGECNSSRKTGSQKRDHSQTITTAEGFQDALQTVVLEAESNGVDVRGGWPVVGNDQERAWDIEITQVSRVSTAQVEETESLIPSIVEAVAVREGVETTDLPPLQGAIDPDSLETLLDTDPSDTQRHVHFEYYGYEITIRSDGSIRLEEAGT